MTARTKHVPKPERNGLTALGHHKWSNPKAVRRWQEPTDAANLFHWPARDRGDVELQTCEVRAFMHVLLVTDGMGKDETLTRSLLCGKVMMILAGQRHSLQAPRWPNLLY